MRAILVSGAIALAALACVVSIVVTVLIENNERAQRNAQRAPACSHLLQVVRSLPLKTYRNDGMVLYDATGCQLVRQQTGK
jgi:hypothetical protein